MYKITVGRNDLGMKEHGAVINARMGLNTWAAFTGRQEDAVIPGDVAPTWAEVLIAGHRSGARSPAIAKSQSVRWETDSAGTEFAGAIDVNTAGQAWRIQAKKTSAGNWTLALLGSDGGSGQGGDVEVLAGGGGANGNVTVGAGSTNRMSFGDTGIGFFAAPQAPKPTVVGSRGGNAALASLLTALSGLGLVTDNTTP